MLKESLKQNLVLVTFSFLLFEVLTGVTLIFMACGTLLSSLGIRPNKVIRNVIALAVFGSYWFKYGKIIDPEIGLNFLTSIIVLKILEKETVRDRYMIFFGLLLLISAGSLFERTLTYILFFAVSFFILIYDFYSYLGQKWKLRDLGLSILWVLPLTFFMFFFVPRLLNPIPFQQNTMAPGEIGYTPDVNISQFESLQTNQGPAFQVSVNKKLDQKDLYWRGNTLSFNDGWNWKEMIQDKEQAQIYPGNMIFSDELVQNFRLFIRSDYFFSLDFPTKILVNERPLSLVGATRTLPQKRWNWVQRYQAISNLNEEITSEGPREKYLQLPLSKREKKTLKETFRGNTFEEVLNSLRSHFLRQGFFYTLSPGQTLSLQDFLTKKAGFCSHYASATALVLRAHGFPSRLVSGFMGGSHNRFAEFYVLSQNDAHVWVEAYHNGKWLRIDPTEWIAPDRVRLGGEAYLESVGNMGNRKSSIFKVPDFFTDFRLWFQQWDFLFYQWLDEMDYHTQESILSKLKLERKWLFSVIPLTILTFMLVYMAFLIRRETKNTLSPHHVMWNLFYQKMKKKGIQLSAVSLLEAEKQLKESNKFSDQTQEVWKALVEYSFSGKTLSVEELKRKIKKL